LLVQLIHHGIIIAPKPPVHGLVLTIRGEPVALTARQEEMALAWARKQGTPYVRDKVFARNFMTDFSAALSLSRRLSVDAVDFGPAIEIVVAERETRAGLTKEERKAAAAVRKVKREELKERYGYAIANGERIELGNYMTEPSGIFMGRGKHPLRGRWKEGAAHLDVTLNMSPDSPRPEGDWAKIVWQPDSLWVARWKDKLSGKLKYVWVSDTAPIKQAREAQKFDKAIELGGSLEAVRAQIQHDLSDPSDKQKMIATACYLIDALCLRVGDEKDPDEADTVGATTLRPEHITLHPDHTVEFRFLGKDSVLWHQRIKLPPMLHENLAYLVENACPSTTNKSRSGRDLPQVFPHITSRDVNSYLSTIQPGLSAKVFRTHHATEVVRDSLAECGVTADDPEYGKREAMVLANLDAAILCNHTKQAPAKWATRRVRMREQRLRAKARVDKVREQVREYRARREALGGEAKEKIAAASDKQRPKVRDRYRKRRAVADRRIEAAKGRLQRARVALGKVESRNKLAGKGRTWNLGTSLKSYIDPRVCYRWGQRVDYEVIEKYYPKALQRKFAWVADSEHQEPADEVELGSGGNGENPVE
jgi:DNA topoisomerase-1